MKEFDPRCERHYPLFIVKAVEPGCTTEIQLENLQTGVIHRISTSDDAEYDEEAYLAAVTLIAKIAWASYHLTEHASGTVAVED